MFLNKIGQKLFFISKIGVNFPMDPITATQNAIAAFFQFLSTDAGQKAADEFLKLDVAFLSKLKDLFDAIHNKIAPPAPKPPAA